MIECADYDLDEFFAKFMMENGIEQSWLKFFGKNLLSPMLWRHFSVDTFTLT